MKDLFEAIASLFDQLLFLPYQILTEIESFSWWAANGVSFIFLTVGAIAQRPPLEFSHFQKRDVGESRCLFLRKNHISSRRQIGSNGRQYLGRLPGCRPIEPSR